MNSPSVPWRVVAVVIAVVVIVLAAVAIIRIARPGSPSMSSGSPLPDSPRTALTAADTGRGFLSAYVEPDGRVVRRDQDGDTVSEGQAYAMLVAVALDDRETFAAVWSWTRQHLIRPDQTLSWRWQNGSVVDPSSAADADLDAARALVIAGQAFVTQS